MLCREERSGMEVEVKAIVSRIRCWWFGCEGHPQDPAPPEYLECMYCGDIVPYGDMVGDTRHNRFKAWAIYWFWRKWWPAKCADCGRRWRACDESVDHIPF